MKNIIVLLVLLVSSPVIAAIVEIDFDQFNDQLLGVGSTQIPDFTEDGFHIEDAGDGSFTAWGQLGLFNRVSGVELFTDIGESLRLREINQSNFDVLSTSVILFNGPDIDYPDTTMVLSGTKTDGSTVLQNVDLGDRFNGTIQLSQLFTDLVEFEISQIGGLYELQVASILVENAPVVSNVPVPPAIILFMSGLLLLFPVHNQAMHRTR